MSGLTPPLPSPGGYERAYAESYLLAFDKLRQADLDGVCLKSGAERVGGDVIRLRFLNGDYLVDRLQGDIIHILSKLEPVPVAEKLLMMHYLVTARGTPPSGESVSFKDLPEGMVYNPTFHKRAVKPVLSKFGASPDGLVAAAAKLGGFKVPLGDAAATIQPFPKVAVTWVLWRGDDEFPADGNVLVDRYIRDYLPTEDIAVLCQLIAYKLCMAA